MYMRIVWGKIVPGKWNEFEAAFEAAMKARGEPKGLVNHWLARDQGDQNAGFSITLWSSETDMQAFWNSDERKKFAASLDKFYVNQFTVTNCETRLALHK